MDYYTFSEIDYSRWEDVGRYITGERNTTPMNEYAMPIEPAYIVPGPPPYDAHQMRPLVPRKVLMVPPVSASTASTTTAGSTPRRTLTDDDRRRVCEYHESHPGAKQTEIGGMSVLDHSHTPS
jgi:hypothetical protein